MDEWQADDVHTSELQWTMPFGPPTRAWLLRPAGRAPRAGLLGLHCHAGVKSIGAERLVDVPQPSRVAVRVRGDLYEGQAAATALARAGFVVLCHDTFAWGSRRFNLAAEDDEAYDVAAAVHEHTVAKAAGILGTSLAGMVAYDDLTALSVLRGIDGVDKVGVFGLSGGGGRAAILTALDPGIEASAVVCMMTTFAGLIPSYVDVHSWLFSTPGLARHLDHPTLAAGRARHRQLVVYAEDDELFSPSGMHDADRELTEHFHYGPGSYEGVFLPGRHRFDAGMQRLVGDFLTKALYT